MKLSKPQPFIFLIILIIATLACSLPGLSAPTPFVFPTPDLTMTALFNPPLEPKATSTSVPPQVQTTTPTQPAQPTSTETQVEPTATPVLSLPTAAPTSTPVATRSSAGPRMRQRNSVAGIYFESAPTIDGKLGDWGLDTYAVDNVVYGAANHTGAGDLSGAMMAGWDEDNLYVGVRVRDDDYVQNASGVFLFKGDSIEVLLDTDVSVDYYVQRLSDDDYQLGISPGSPNVGEEVEAYLWYPASVEGSRSNVNIGVEELDNGYRIEAAIPWSIFGVTPEEGKHFGFAVSISDNDRSGEEVQQSMVSNVPTRRLTDPTTWGDLTLVKP